MSNVQSHKSATETIKTSSGIRASQSNPTLRSVDIEPTQSLDFQLHVSDLRKTFVSTTADRVEVLRGVSLSATAGEAVAIMGTSGAGKSTLLHLLGGLEAPDHGTIEAGKFSVDRAGATTLARFRNRQIGFVFQFHHLLPDLTAEENVSMPLRIAGVRARAAMAKARALLNDIGLDARVAQSLIGHLSGGEQQRVAVCRALITNPSLVLADEPTGNLDAATGEQIGQSLVNYSHQQGGLVIIATHNRAVADMCDRILVLSEGRLHPA
jgi:lipoprotein-releasing system ATP-binding protein